MEPRLHWPEYALEAALLGGFMIVACTFGVLLDYPASPLARALPAPLARRAVFGLVMGATVIAIVYSRAGKRSGAHLNPAITLAFLSLGKVRPRDAAAYAAAQALGAVAGVLLAWAALGERLAHPAVHFVTTRPGAAGALPALAGEALVSFGLVSVVLGVSASRRAAWTGVCAGVLLALAIALESPISGTSLNPARSLGSALAAGELGDLWIYFLAPPLGTLAAAGVMRRRAARACAKLRHVPDVPCIFCGQGQAPAAPRRAA